MRPGRMKPRITDAKTPPFKGGVFTFALNDVEQVEQNDDGYRNTDEPQKNATHKASHFTLITGCG
jgi:hypothetical protein